MKRTIYILLFSFIVIIPILLGTATPMKMTDAREKNAVIRIETEPNLEIHEGYVSQKDETVLVKQGRKTIAKVHLGEPVVVAQAEQEEKWGYYQFPNIGKADDGTLIVQWQMQDDSHLSYGKKTDRKYKPQMSKDNGKTWIPMDKSYSIYRRDNNVYLKNGGYIEVKTQQAKDVRSYNDFPKAVFSENNYKYYDIERLPKELQGVYINYRDKNNRWEIIHAKLYDPGALRYAIDDQMPIVWWGNIRQLADSSLVAGIYPSYYVDHKGSLLKGGISFYTSKDNGRFWTITGKISYAPDEIVMKRGNGEYYEPAFEILPDSTFICVMRTGAKSPMCCSYSTDKGRTWTQPKPFTPNGVKPQLLLLGNGVLVLTSGRPGVQLRFNIDGKGRKWTEPIDMVPIISSLGLIPSDVSCGYTSMVETGKNTFMLVYSDFTAKDKNGRMRKAILCRKITVII